MVCHGDCVSHELAVGVGASGVILHDGEVGLEIYAAFTGPFGGDKDRIEHHAPTVITLERRLNAVVVAAEVEDAGAGLAGAQFCDSGIRLVRRLARDVNGSVSAVRETRVGAKSPVGDGAGQRQIGQAAVELAESAIGVGKRAGAGGVEHGYATRGVKLAVERVVFVGGDGRALAQDVAAAGQKTADSERLGIGVRAAVVVRRGHDGETTGGCEQREICCKKNLIIVRREAGCGEHICLDPVKGTIRHDRDFRFVRERVSDIYDGVGGKPINGDVVAPVGNDGHRHICVGALDDERASAEVVGIGNCNFEQKWNGTRAKIDCIFAFAGGNRPFHRNIRVEQKIDQAICLKVERSAAQSLKAVVHRDDERTGGNGFEIWTYARKVWIRLREGTRAKKNRHDDAKNRDSQC